MHFEGKPEQTLEQFIESLKPEELKQIDNYILDRHSRVVMGDFSLTHERLYKTNQDIVENLKTLFSASDSLEKIKIGNEIVKLLLTWQEQEAA